MTVTRQRLRDQQIAILGAGSVGDRHQRSAGRGDDGRRAVCVATLAPPSGWSTAKDWSTRAAGVSMPSNDHTHRTIAVSKAGDRPLPRGVDLHEVVRHVHPGVLIGVSAQPGAFTEPIIREMADGVTQPIVFALSNPTSKSEAVPADLMAWTEGRGPGRHRKPVSGRGPMQQRLHLSGCRTRRHRLARAPRHRRHVRRGRA